MKRILVTVPSREELAPLTLLFENDRAVYEMMEKRGVSLKFLVTGTGITATVYQMTKILAAESFDLVIQAGIAGAVTDQLAITQVVEVTQEQFTGYGIVKGGNFIHASEYPFLKDGHLFGKVLKNPVNHELSLEKHAGQTVYSINYDHPVREDSCLVESMEGAAFFYVCLLEGVDFCQIRAISNYTGIHDKKLWKTAEALNHLAENVHRIIKSWIV